MYVFYMKENISVALVISTYNSPAYLSLCLRSVAAQTVLPDEIVIADDGSGDETARVVAGFTCEMESLAVVKHIWHADEGFRLGPIKNKAVAAASGEYLIQLDGDLVLHRDFVRDHLSAVQQRTYVTGSRVMLGAEKTRQMLEQGKIRVNVFAGGCANAMNGLRLPLLSRFFRSYRSTDPYFSRGGLMGCWRKDFLEVNGFDERLMGWGWEDTELVTRMRNAGIRASALKYKAVTYHLYHKESPRDQACSNKEAFLRTWRQGIVRCAEGVDKYLSGASGD